MDVVDCERHSDHRPDSEGDCEQAGTTQQRRSRTVQMEQPVQPARPADHESESHLPIEPKVPNVPALHDGFADEENRRQKSRPDVSGWTGLVDRDNTAFRKGGECR